MKITAHHVLRSEGIVTRFYFTDTPPISGSTGFSRALAGEVLELQGLKWHERDTALVNAEAWLGHPIHFAPSTAGVAS